MPVDTKILTRHGWLQHDEVVAGAETIGIAQVNGELQDAIRLAVYLDVLAARGAGTRRSTPPPAGSGSGESS